jgi:hypothetical protein
MQGILIVLLASGCRSTAGLASELHPVCDHLWAFVFGDVTEYASGYTDAGFNAIRVGTPATEVGRFVGAPLALLVVEDTNRCGWLTLHENRIQQPDRAEACERIGIHGEMSVADVLAVANSATVRWLYSRSASSANYWRRVVTTGSGRVSEIDRSLYPQPRMFLDPARKYSAREAAEKL